MINNEFSYKILQNKFYQILKRLGLFFGFILNQFLEISIFENIFVTSDFSRKLENIEISNRIDIYFFGILDEHRIFIENCTKQIL